MSDRVGLIERPASAAWSAQALVALTMVGFIAIKSARDALFLSRPEGAKDLPIAFALAGLSALVAAAVHVQAMKAFGVRRVRTALYVGLPLLLLAFTPFLAGASPAAFIVLFAAVPVGFAALFADAWLLVGELSAALAPSERARAFFRAGMASTIGGLVGAMLARALAEVASPVWVLAFGAATLLLGAWLSHVTHLRHRARPAPLRDPPSVGLLRGLGSLLARPFVLLLAGIASVGAAAGLLVDAQLYVALARDGRADMASFADLYFALSAVALLFQLLVAGRLQKRLGVLGTLLILPIGLAGVAGWVTVQSSIAARFTLSAAEGGLKSAVHRTSWEQVFMPVPEELRPMVKIVVDGAAARLAESATAVALYLFVVGPGLPEPNLPLLGTMTLGALGLWSVLTFGLRHFIADRSDVVEFRLADACPVALVLGRERPS